MPTFACALCPERFSSELDRARHFAREHPISELEELNAIIERIARRDLDGARRDDREPAS